MDRAKLLLKILGKSFEMKIDRLEKSFFSAIGPFRSELSEVQEAHDAFKRDVDAGRAKWEETTEDGELYDHGEELAERRDDADEAMLTLRKAFTFLVYHQWERMAQYWASPDKAPNHEDLVKLAKRAGVPLDEPGLKVMRLLVNTLKHNSAKYGAELFQLRPDLFKAGFDPEEISPISGKKLTKINWSDQIALTNENVEAFILIARNSAPPP